MPRWEKLFVTWSVDKLSSFVSLDGEESEEVLFVEVDSVLSVSTEGVVGSEFSDESFSSGGTVLRGVGEGRRTKGEEVRERL